MDSDHLAGARLALMDANAMARRVRDRVRDWIVAAPGTHILLLILVVTTLLLVGLDQVTATRVLRAGSTNLVQMARDGPRVLFLSAFLLGPGNIVIDLLRIEIVFVPLERWLGTWRWLAVVTAGHVGATMATTVGIWWQVRHGIASGALAYPVDVGISYALFAGAGSLVSWFRRPASIVVAAGLVGLAGAGLVRSGTFTDWGHAAALAIGLTLGPLLRPTSVRATNAWYGRWLAHAPDVRSDRHRRRAAVVVGFVLLIAAGAFTAEALTSSPRAAVAASPSLVTARVVGRPPGCIRGCGRVVVTYPVGTTTRSATVQVPAQTFVRRGDSIKVALDAAGNATAQLAPTADRIDLSGLFGAAAITALATALLVLMVTLRRARPIAGA
jgi:hypothetical protein